MIINMRELIIIGIAMLMFMSAADYLYVNVGEWFVDQDGEAYQVTRKNVFSVTISSKTEQKTIPTMWLCMRYMKVDM